MNLYLRLLLLLLSLPRLPKQTDPLAPTTLAMRVMPNDLDIYWHMNNSRYLSIMDLGRLHFVAALGLLGPLRQQRWDPLLGAVKIHFLKPLTVFQSFSLTTQLLYWDEKWFYMEQKILKKDQLYAVALLKILFVNKENKISPQDVIQLLLHPPACPPLPPAIEQWKMAERASRNPL